MRLGLFKKVTDKVVQTAEPAAKKIITHSVEVVKDNLANNTADAIESGCKTALGIGAIIAAGLIFKHTNATEAVKSVVKAAASAPSKIVNITKTYNNIFVGKEVDTATLNDILNGGKLR